MGPGRLFRASAPQHGRCLRRAVEPVAQVETGGVGAGLAAGADLAPGKGLATDPHVVQERVRRRGRRPSQTDAGGVCRLSCRGGQERRRHAVDVERHPVPAVLLRAPGDRDMLQGPRRQRLAGSRAGVGAAAAPSYVDLPAARLRVEDERRARADSGEHHLPALTVRVLRIVDRLVPGLERARVGGERRDEAELVRRDSPGATEGSRHEDRRHRCAQRTAPLLGLEESAKRWVSTVVATTG